MNNNQNLKYDTGVGEDTNWIVQESSFNANFTGKCEAIMALGNGYMGLRSAHEERYPYEKRDLLISGTFNKFDSYEVTELPNAADITNIEIYLNGVRFNLETGKIVQYKRQLNLKTGLLTREISWEHPACGEVELTFERFISKENLHLIGMQISIFPKTMDVDVAMKSGVDAQTTSSGAQHFHEGEKRIYDRKVIEVLQETTESKITFFFNAFHNFSSNDSRKELDPEMEIDRRKVSLVFKDRVKCKTNLKMEKIITVHTTRDAEFSNSTFEEVRAIALTKTKTLITSSFNELFRESAQGWTRFWEESDIKIEGNNFDQLGIRFAQYHLQIMTPAHDNRMGIGAKGLSGEGYKGHSFWDTEVFILPYFMYTNPEIARNLLTYRYNTLPGAYKKAQENNYKGAMFPWESAWIDDGEVTPVWGGVDVVTGKATKILSGFIEQHITADISYAIWQYFKISNDVQFMEACGYELLFKTAEFWCSRLEWDETRGKYVILNVIGPDEYKENIDNNAFTNYMVHFNLEIVLEYAELLQKTNKELFESYDRTWSAKEIQKNIQSVIDKIYLPKPNEELILPQDDTYLTKKQIDLSKYKNQENVGSMFKDFSLHQVNEIQVSKQADVVLLFYLLENKFDMKTKQANFDYYEAKTLHDSSLSLSTHSILANDLKDSELAYTLFQKALEIDMGPNMKTSDHGIHAASIAGIWQCSVNGFGGVRMLDGELHISPTLPNSWLSLQFKIFWQGTQLEIKVNKDYLLVENFGNIHTKFRVHGKEQQLDSKSKIKINF